MIAEAKFWDGIARKYAKSTIKDQDSYAYSLRETANLLGPQDRVLELGCGTGPTALHLAAHVGHITGTDISSEMVAIARERLADSDVSNANFQVATATELPDGSYDAVLAFNLLHLVQDLDQALAAVHEKLPVGGLFISKTFVKPPRLGLHLEYRLTRLALPIMQAVGKAPFVHFLQPGELADRMRRVGFEILRSEPIPPHAPRDFIVARKA